MAASDSIPQKNWTVPAELDAAHLDRIVREVFPESSWNRVRAWIRGGNVLVNGVAVSDSTATVAEGAEIIVSPKPSLYKSAGQKAPVAKAPKLLVHVDSQLVVVEKPCGISTVPYDRDERDTLDRRVQGQLARTKSRAKLLVVHRIDKETTGLLVFARTQSALEHLKSQFRFHTVERKYYALVHGHPRHMTHKSLLVRDRGDGLRGSTTNPKLGREATTHVRVVEKYANASLIECELETGRTHQIRIHLAEAGHPLLGERVYIKGYEGPIIEAPRVMLHAATLGFQHPGEGQRMSFSSDLPLDFQMQQRKLANK